MLLLPTIESVDILERPAFDLTSPIAKCELIMGDLAILRVYCDVFDPVVDRCNSIQLSVVLHGLIRSCERSHLAAERRNRLCLPPVRP